jgi:cytochrome c oxidase subunit IV
MNYLNFRRKHTLSYMAQAQKRVDFFDLLGLILISVLLIMMETVKGLIVIPRIPCSGWVGFVVYLQLNTC